MIAACLEIGVETLFTEDDRYLSYVAIYIWTKQHLCKLAHPYEAIRLVSSNV